MRRVALAVALLGCASSADRQRVAWAEGPPPADASVEDAGMAAREVAWNVAHLADDPDPSRLGESQAVRRLASLGDDALRATAEVFRVGDERRIPFARRVFERVVARRCRHDVARTTRTLRAMQGAGTDPDGGYAAPWLERSGRWSNEAVERLRAWIDAGARCAE